jgi:hypothetical protein
VFDGSRSSTVIVFTVVGSIASLKVTFTFASTLTSRLPSVGKKVETVGIASVVKAPAASKARELPARSFTRGSVAPPLTSILYVVPAARFEFGSSVAVIVAAS